MQLPRPLNRSARGLECKTIFLHLPKSAGTSLRALVRAEYPDDRLLLVYASGPDDLRALKKRAQTADALYGHMYFGIHESLGVNALYVTVLRHPLDRVVSFYRHVARDPGSEYYQPIADGLTLRELILSETCHQVNNSVVRTISGYGGSETILDRRLVDLAEANMDAHFSVVGLSDRMEESVALIAKTLDWRTTEWQVPWENVDPDPYSFVLDETTRDVILSFNLLDLELYERVASKTHQFATLPADLVMAPVGRRSLDAAASQR